MLVVESMCCWHGEHRSQDAFGKEPAMLSRSSSEDSQYSQLHSNNIDMERHCQVPINATLATTIVNSIVKLQAVTT